MDCPLNLICHNLQKFNDFYHYLLLVPMGTTRMVPNIVWLSCHIKKNHIIMRQCLYECLSLLARVISHLTWPLKWIQCPLCFKSYILSPLPINRFNLTIYTIYITSLIIFFFYQYIKTNINIWEIRFVSMNNYKLSTFYNFY